ncbi:MAG: methylated-DNA--[protein]-cysteine S-methyltransferase [Gemmatimonadales bacterium]|jgi:methylated-DNA-[protein]-cysteine S-methyltransferase
MTPTQPFTVTTAVTTLAVTLDGTAVVRIALNARGDRPPSADAERRVARQLMQYAEGKRRRFTFAVKRGGTPFERRVWDAVARIPYGETATYADIARRIGHPRAYRAVGAANGKNPLPLVVPCHRVVASGGGLGGYGGGVALKRRLLALERADVRGSRRGTVLYGTVVVCALLMAAACAEPTRPEFEQFGPDTVGPTISFTNPPTTDTLVDAGSDVAVDVLIEDRSSVESVAAAVLGAFAIGYETVFPEDTTVVLTYRIPVPETATGQFVLAVVALDSLHNRTRSDRAFTIR